MTQSLNLFLSANNQPPQQPSPLIFFIFPSSTTDVVLFTVTMRTRVHTTTTVSPVFTGKFLYLSCFTSCKNSLVFSSLSITTSARGVSFSLSVSFSDVNISLIGSAGSNFDCNIDLHLLSLGAHCLEQR